MFISAPGRVADAALDPVSRSPLDVLHEFTERFSTSLTTRRVGRDLCVRRQVEHVWKPTLTTRAHVQLQLYTRNVCLLPKILYSYIQLLCCYVLYIARRSGLAVACLTAVREVLGSNRAVVSCVYHTTTAIYSLGHGLCAPFLQCLGQLSLLPYVVR